MKRIFFALIFIATSFLLFHYNTAHAGVLIDEKFDDTNFAARGWYDNTSFQLSTTEHIPGSTSSVKFHFAKGATHPDSGAASRHLFTATDEFYVEFWVKYSSNWVGSGVTWHPHEMHILSNMDGAWSGLARAYLSVYIEETALRPRLIIQDGQNINLSYGSVPRDLVNTTETRAVGGCNGDSDGLMTSDECYKAGSNWRNSSMFDYPTAAISAGVWHKVTVHIKLNSISSGKGQQDGIMQYWLDDTLLIDHSTVVYRTAAHPNILFNQYAISPYIDVGSPVDQTFWVDDLIISTTKPASGGPQPPKVPIGFKNVP